jgi:16S rRNA G966 N2-methylase RsmD
MAEPGWSCLGRNAQGTGINLRRSNLYELGTEEFRDQAVIFLDPPYESAPALWSQLAPRLARWIAPTGVLIFETGRHTVLELQTGWRLAETREYGAARFHLWMPA